MPTENADVSRARQETIRYHEELYSTARLGDPGSWLHRPHRLLAEALEPFAHDDPITVYDLGCGIGRHTLPLLRNLPEGSAIYAVDLLPSALEALADTAPDSRLVELALRQSDLAEFEFEKPADLVFAFSAIEHLTSERDILDLFTRVHECLKIDGVFALGMIVDRHEEHADGSVRPALLESQLTCDAAQALISSVFGSYRVLADGVRPADAAESRDGAEYLLRATLVTCVLQKVR